MRYLKDGTLMVEKSARLESSVSWQQDWLVAKKLQIRSLLPLLLWKLGFNSPTLSLVGFVDESALIYDQDQADTEFRELFVRQVATLARERIDDGNDWS